jgi:hypothetical protein
MKLDPGIHIGSTWFFFGKSGVTVVEELRARRWGSSGRDDGGAPTSERGDVVGGGGAPTSMAQRPPAQRRDDNLLFFLPTSRSTASATSSAPGHLLPTSPLAGRINRSVAATSSALLPTRCTTLATLIGPRAGTGRMAHRAYCRASDRRSPKN